MSTPEAEPDIHPIGEVLAAVLQDGPDGTPSLDSDGLRYVERALDEYLDAGEALMGAVDCLLTAAHLLEVEKGARATAVALVGLVDRQQVVRALVAINEAKEAERAQAVEARAGRFQQFTADAQAKPQAPDEGRDPPDGARKLGTFHFPKRL